MAVHQVHVGCAAGTYIDIPKMSSNPLTLTQSILINIHDCGAVAECEALVTPYMS